MVVAAAGSAKADDEAESLREQLREALAVQRSLELELAAREEESNLLRVLVARIRPLFIPGASGGASPQFGRKPNSSLRSSVLEILEHLEATQAPVNGGGNDLCALPALAACRLDGGIANRHADTRVHMGAASHNDEVNLELPAHQDWRRVNEAELELQAYHATWQHRGDSNADRMSYPDGTGPLLNTPLVVVPEEACEWSSTAPATPERHTPPDVAAAHQTGVAAVQADVFASLTKMAATVAASMESGAATLSLDEPEPPPKADAPAIMEPTVSISAKCAGAKGASRGSCSQVGRRPSPRQSPQPSSARMRRASPGNSRTTSPSRGRGGASASANAGPAMGAAGSVTSPRRGDASGGKCAPPQRGAGQPPARNEHGGGRRADDGPGAMQSSASRRTCTPSRTERVSASSSAPNSSTEEATHGSSATTPAADCAAGTAIDGQPKAVAPRSVFQGGSRRAPGDGGGVVTSSVASRRTRTPAR